jgi:hypothetical protein
MTRRLRLLVTAACLPVLLASLASVTGAAARPAAASGFRAAAPAARPHPATRRGDPRGLRRDRPRPLGPAPRTARAPRAARCTEPACPVDYHGGKVQTSPKVYVILWGPDWEKSRYAGAEQYLKRFYAGLGVQPDDDWSTTTEQYANSFHAHPSISGSVLAGVWVDPTPPPKHATGREIVDEAGRYYRSRGLSDPRDTQIVVATQSGTCPLGFYSPAGGVCNDPSGTYCAWHAATGSTGFTVVNLPYQPDAGRKCGADAVHDGPASGYEGFSISGGAEFADAVTDPYPPTGWIDESEGSTGEISDKCVHAKVPVANVKLATGWYAMQPLWSNAAGRCVFASPTLSVSTAGSGTGTVTGARGTIDCGHRCTASYPPRTTVSLTASPGSGSVFSGWQGGCTGVGRCVLAMTKPRQVTATFSPAATVPVTIAGAGGVTGPAGVDCATSCQARLPRGGRVTLTATPDSGAVLAGWTGACRDMVSTRCAFTATGGATVGARFTTGRLYRASTARYGQGWSTSPCPCYFGGTSSESTTAGAAATFTFTGRAVSLVSDRSPTGGSFTVYVDGVLSATRSDYSGSRAGATVVWARTFSRPGPHTVRIVNAGTSGHPSVAVDGFIVDVPLFGTTMTKGVGAEAAKFGFPPPVIRDFSFGLPRPVRVTGSAGVIYSFETMPSDKQFRNWLNSLNPNQHVWWAYRHEVDREIRHHETTLATWKRQLKRLIRLAANRPNLTATIILTGYEFTKPGHQGFYPPSSFWVPGAQALGGDLDGISAKSYPDFGPQIAGMRAAAAKLGAPALLVPEFGSPTVRGDTGARAKARWLRRWAQTLFEDGFTAVTYYDANGEALVKRAEINAWSYVMTSW